MLGCCRLPEKFNTRPSPVWNYACWGSSEYESNEIIIYGKRRSSLILSSKIVKHYCIILIILIIIIAPRKLGNPLCNWSFSVQHSKTQIFLSSDTSQPQRETPDVIRWPKYWEEHLVVFSKMLVVLVVSEIRKSIACLILLRTKQFSNWFLFWIILVWHGFLAHQSRRLRVSL